MGYSGLRFIGRHHGWVEAIHHGAYVKIKWRDTSWISTVELDAGEI
jgi:hypothetical protein